MVERRGDRYVFTGRRGGIINVGGAKVHPEEVEAAINAHAAVRASRVFARKNPITGALVAAEVVLREGVAGDDDLSRDILSSCRVALPAHKAPSFLRFVAELPMTSGESSRAMDNVVVTGASRGIGLAIAARLAREGFAVVAVARKRSEALGKAEADAAGALCFEPFDLNEIAAIPAFVRELRARRGPIYGLVNNAGIGTEGLLATMANADIEALVRLNTLSPIVLTKYVVRGMMAEGRGRVVNMSSIVASTGYNALSVYAATKAALVGFTRSLAREVGRVGVTVNAIAPGFVDTEMTRGLEADARARIAARSALRRLAEAEDVAAMAAFLMGEGGRNISGAVMTVDAGGTA